MTKDTRRRQKAQMKKHSKNKKRKAKARARSNVWFSPEYQIRHAREYPIHECWISRSWKKQGISNIILSRKQPDEDIVFGVYLVDLFCLGLKDTFYNANFNQFRYENELRDPAIDRQDMIECPVPLAMEIIYGAIDYAANLGFSPHKDFKLGKYILEEKERVNITGKVEFGKDGMPFYVAGRDDDVDRIMATLKNSVGEGNFHFIVPVTGSDFEVL